VSRLATRSTRAAEKAVGEADAHEAERTDTEGNAPDVRTAGRRRVEWKRILTFGIAPALAFLLTVAAGYLRWTDSSVRDSEAAATESVQSATAGTIKMLSYAPQTVERDLGAARDGLTGPFRDSYTQLTNNVVIPGSKQKNITAVATVPAASSVSASANHAVTLLFVDQTITVGNDAPSDTASAVKVTLDKVAGRWLISDLTPV
jgi:Mce-associated membrane protein